MEFTEKNKAFIKILYVIIGYGLRKFMREFPDKGRERSGLDNLIMKLLKKVDVQSQRKRASGIPRTARIGLINE